VQYMPAILVINGFLQRNQYLFDFLVLRIKFDNAEYEFLVQMCLLMSLSKRFNQALIVHLASPVVMSRVGFA